MDAPVVGLPPFHFHPESLAFLAGLILTYLFALFYVGNPRGLRAGKRQMALFFSGAAIAYISVSWPLHDISDDYLYSAHMIQHILLMLVVPPLLIGGVPDWLFERILPAPVATLLRKLSHPVTATLIFNGAVAVSHWPVWIDLMSRSNFVHQISHLTLILASVIMWMPVVGPATVSRRLSPPGQMLYLFVQSILPTVPASFFTFADRPLVSFYSDAPRLWGIGVLADQQLAGFVMKVVGGLVIWSYIAAIFFRWYAREGHEAGIPPRFRGNGGGGVEPPDFPSDDPGLVGETLESEESEKVLVGTG